MIFARDVSGLILKPAWSDGAGTSLKSARVQESTAVKGAFLPSFHPGLQEEKMDRLSDPNAGQAWTEPDSCWTFFHGCISVLDLRLGPHCRTPETSGDSNPLLTVVRRDGERGTEDETWLYLGCCDVVPRRITFKFNSSSPRLLRDVNVSWWHIWTCPTAHTCKRSL